MAELSTDEVIFDVRRRIVELLEQGGRESLIAELEEVVAMMTEVPKLPDWMRKEMNKGGVVLRPDEIPY